MNIYFHELRFHVKSFLIWSAAMIFLIAAGMMKYSAFAKTGQVINDMFQTMPTALLEALGIQTGSDLSSIGVFYSIFFLYFLLLTTVHSCLLGASIIAKEERDKTADFLFVKPIKRSPVVTAKLFAALTLVILYNLVTFGASVLFVNQFNTTGQSLIQPIAFLMIALFIVQFLFLAIGLFLGAKARNAARASSLAAGVILGTFIIKVMIDLKEDLDYLEFLSPFRYFNSSEVMFDHQLPIGYTLLSLGLTILLVAGAYYFFQKRDLHS